MRNMVVKRDPHSLNNHVPHLYGPSNNFASLLTVDKSAIFSQTMPWHIEHNFSCSIAGYYIISESKEVM